MNLISIYGNDNLVLLATLLLLAGMSVISWYIIFWKSWSIRSERRFLDVFRKQYLKTLDWPKHADFKKIHGQVQWLVEESENLKPILANYPPADRREILAMHLVQAIDLVRVHSDRGLTFLASIGSCAPFIGLFGTVWGIYGALMKIASEGNAGLAVVAGPMGAALVATAFGLFAAIPAVMAYNVFVRQNRLLIQDLRHIAEQMTMYLSLSPLQDHALENVKLIRGGH